MCSIRTLNGISGWIQPPDAENRMSGGVGEVTGAIPLPRPDHFINVELSESKYKRRHVLFYGGDLQAAKVFM